MPNILLLNCDREVIPKEDRIWEMGTETIALAAMSDYNASKQNFWEVINHAISSNLINLVRQVDKFVDVVTALKTPSLSIDAVVLDLSLQDADDFEQISCIHSLFPQVPIVIISDWDDEAKLLQAIQAGSDEYLIKSQITPLLLRRCLLGAIERCDRESRQQIRERKQNELQMRQRKEAAEAGSRTKSSFLATMSHELRTPLNAIMGLSQLLQKEMGGNLSERQQEYVNCIYTSGEHLLTLIDDILDLSKLEAGKEELQLVSLSVRDLCRNVILMVCDRADAKGLEIAVNIADDVEICIADERRLKQMLLNLLINAIKFTEVGKVLLEVKYTEIGINFIVTDTGIGIKREHFKLLFEPFKQLDSQLNRHYEGTGLGLALTRKLARLHGGDVTIESTVGVGSRFTLLLPHLNSLNLNSLNSNSLNINLNLDFQRILLVEDEENTAILLQDYLQTIGYAVDVMISGEKFLERVRGYRPDLILLDVQLVGDISGLDLLAALREQQDLQELPVVMMTPMGIIDTPSHQCDRFLQAGANDCLSKPIGIFQLESVLMKYLS